MIDIATHSCKEPKISDIATHSCKEPKISDIATHSCKEPKISDKLTRIIFGHIIDVIYCDKCIITQNT